MAKLQESKIWKDTIGVLQRLGESYIHLLSNSFRNMSRDGQEELITNFSLLLTLGGIGLAWCPIYSLIPSLIRLLALPLSLALGYWFGRNIVSRIMIDRFSKYLNSQ